jgi:prevent-host-death family protein
VNVTLKELKIQPGRILSMAEEGTEVIVTVRGVPKAKIIPIRPMAAKDPADTSGFGLWAEHSKMEDVDSFVRNLRKGRGYDR